MSEQRLMEGWMCRALSAFELPYQTSQRAWHWAGEWCRWLSFLPEPETSWGKRPGSRKRCPNRCEGTEKQMHYLTLLDICEEYAESPTRWIIHGVPSGLVEEHDRGIVDQLEGDGQSFTLTPGETASACLSTFKETQSSQDLIHLRHTDSVGTWWQKLLFSYDVWWRISGNLVADKRAHVNV